MCGKSQVWVLVFLMHLPESTYGVYLRRWFGVVIGRVKQGGPPVVFHGRPPAA